MLTDGLALAIPDLLAADADSVSAVELLDFASTRTGRLVGKEQTYL